VAAASGAEREGKDGPKLGGPGPHAAVFHRHVRHLPRAKSAAARGQARGRKKKGVRTRIKRA
jgi:hypothetical protein